jgi:hypothetical protein
MTEKNFLEATLHIDPTLLNRREPSEGMTNAGALFLDNLVPSIPSSSVES